MKVLVSKCRKDWIISQFFKGLISNLWCWRYHRLDLQSIVFYLTRCIQRVKKKQSLCTWQYNWQPTCIGIWPDFQRLAQIRSLDMDRLTHFHLSRLKQAASVPVCPYFKPMADISWQAIEVGCAYTALKLATPWSLSRVWFNSWAVT